MTHLKAYGLNHTEGNNSKLYSLMCDNGSHPTYVHDNPLTKMYIVADNNILSGFKGQRDSLETEKRIENLLLEIECLQQQLRNIKTEEDLSICSEKVLTTIGWFDELVGIYTGKIPCISQKI